MNTSPLHVHTPLIPSISLQDITQKQVFLKLENLQPTGSFKIRGIGHLCQKEKANGFRHFVASSGGNAGYAVAYSGMKLGITTTVFVPESTSQQAIQLIEQLNAKVVVKGTHWDETDQFARQYCKQVNGRYVSPFDDPLIWEGHATMIDEIAATTTPPEAIVLSVGGGGLLCGVLEGLHRNNWKHVPVYIVETRGTASFYQSVRENRHVSLDKIEGVATSLGAKKIARKAFEWKDKHEIHPVLVTDKQAINACVEFAHGHRMLVEPACGASLAVLYSQLPALEQAQNILVIVCGGINVNPEKLLQWKGKKGKER